MPPWQEFLCLLTSSFCLISAQVDRNLVYVQAIWRHGSRAPFEKPYPNDPYDESAWPRGWRQLTNLGIQQMYELGKYFRKKYRNFVSRNYVAEEIYIMSSASDEAITSAQAFTSGFYPADDIFQWQNGSSWQPVPIHAPGREVPDILLRPLSVKCEVYKKLILKERKKENDIYEQQYRELFDFFEEETGFEFFSYSDIESVYDIYEELAHNLTELQPLWVSQTWLQYGNRSTLEIVKELKQKRAITKYNSFEKAKIMGGYLLNNFVQSALMVASGQKTVPEKMLLYSSHESTILSLVHAMDVTIELLVPYAAALIMEIYTENGEYLAEFLYRNESTHPPYRIVLPGCGNRCTVQKFVEQYSNMTLKSFDQWQQLHIQPQILALFIIQEEKNWCTDAGPIKHQWWSRTSGTFLQDNQSLFLIALENQGY